MDIVSYVLMASKVFDALSKKLQKYKKISGLN